MFSFGMVRGTILSGPQPDSEPLKWGLTVLTAVLTNSEEVSCSPVKVSSRAGCLGYVSPKAAACFRPPSAMAYHQSSPSLSQREAGYIGCCLQTAFSVRIEELQHLHVPDPK